MRVTFALRSYPDPSFGTWCSKGVLIPACRRTANVSGQARPGGSSIHLRRTLHYSANSARGRDRFDRLCARCHSGNARAPDLTRSDLSDVERSRIIRFGHPGSLMGGFRDMLSKAEVADILAWIHLARYDLERCAEGHRPN
ncbi:MAG: cytochrome c [Deltaproteobacteria bacterium]|nr:MAG: cytochrome c [Deltaproteobacteria bacterium]